MGSGVLPGICIVQAPPMHRMGHPLSGLEKGAEGHAQTRHMSKISRPNALQSRQYLRSKMLRIEDFPVVSPPPNHLRISVLHQNFGYQS